jgi:hypothetical protein
MKAVLLTVPHSFCRDEWHACQTEHQKECLKEQGHPCDFLAECAAETLHSQLNLARMDVTTLTHPGERALCDMNRTPSLISPWRYFIEQWLDYYRQTVGSENVYLLDIHSYWAGAYGQPDADVTLLDMHPVYDQYYPSSISLKNSLDLNSDITVKLIKGEGNSIVEIARLDPIGGAWLIEFNEDTLPCGSDRLHSAIASITTWLINWSSQPQMLEMYTCPTMLCYQHNDGPKNCST